MSPSSTATDDELHTEIRATLHRHAGDVEPDPPDWQELVQRPRPVVVSLRTGASSGPDIGGASPRWARPAVAAAAALVVLLAAVALANDSPTHRTGPFREGQPAQRSTSPPPTTGGPLTSPVIPAPGDADFDPGTGHVYPVDGVPDGPDATPDDYADQADPRTLTLRYLQDRLGVPESSLQVGEPNVIPSPTPDDINTGPSATVRWASRDESTGSTTAQGTVHLYQYNSDTGPVWNVAGSTTDGVRLTDVRRDLTRLSFVIDRRADPEAADVAVSIVTAGGPNEEADEVIVPVPGGHQIADGAWLVDVQPGQRLTVTVPVHHQSNVNVALGHVGGRWLSITEMNPPHDAAEQCDIACPDPG